MRTFVAGCAVVLVISLIAWKAASNLREASMVRAASERLAADAAAARKAAIAAAPDAPPEPRTFTEELERLRPLMTDAEDDHPNKGGMLLAMWGEKHLRWSDVNIKTNETNAKLIKKDPAAERGKRLCGRGQIIMIKKVYETIFAGQMLVEDGNVFFFEANGTTGNLVEGDKARFCGVFVGENTYETDLGGKVRAIGVVGMFDLPENRHD